MKSHNGFVEHLYGFSLPGSHLIYRSVQARLVWAHALLLYFFHFGMGWLDGQCARGGEPKQDTLEDMSLSIVMKNENYHQATTLQLKREFLVTMGISLPHVVTSSAPTTFGRCIPFFVNLLFVTRSQQRWRDATLKRNCKPRHKHHSSSTDRYCGDV